MLLAGREGQHEAAPPFGIDRLADQTARKVTHEFFLRGEETKAGPPKVIGTPKLCPFADGDIGTPSSRGL